MRKVSRIPARLGIKALSTTLKTLYTVFSWAYGGDNKLEVNKFCKNYDFDNQKFFQMQDIYNTLALNYGKFILNKMMIVVDQIMFSVYYKDPKTATPLGDQNYGKYRLRWKWVDAYYEGKLPSLDFESSENMNERRYKCTKSHRIKKTIYPRCRSSITTTKENMNKCFTDMCTQMDAIHVPAPRLLIGWGPFLSIPNDSQNEVLLVNIGVRIRIYGFFTFSARTVNNRMYTDSANVVMKVSDVVKDNLINKNVTV